MVSVHCSVVCQNRNGCSGNGECVLGVCQCDTGHTGTRCETSEFYTDNIIGDLSTYHNNYTYSCVCTERISNM